MSISDDMSNFLQRIYLSPYDPENWQRMATELMDLTNSCALMFSGIDTDCGNILRTSLFGPENSKFADAITEYRENLYVQDPTLNFALAHPYAGYCDSVKAIGRREYEHDAYVRWNSDRLGASHWLVGYTSPSDGMTFGLSVHTPKAIGHITPSAEKTFRFVFPHIAHAVRLCSKPSPFPESDHAVFILNASGAVSQCNDQASALVAGGDGLRIVGHQLVPSAHAVRRDFNQIIQKICRQPSTWPEPEGFRLPRPSGRRSLVCKVEPLPFSNPTAAAFGAVAMITVFEPTSARKISIYQQSLFGFSPRETEVINFLLNGHSPDSVAAVLSISIATVRIHVRALLRKTETNRQSQLIELLSRTK